jgi:tripeptidyl-peptidase-2
VDTLEKLVNMPLALDLSISKSISLPLAASIGDAFTGNADGVFKKKTLQRGGRTCFFIGNNTSLPKEAKYGDILLGKLDIAECKNLDGPMYRVQYRVPPEIPSFDDKKSVEEPEKEGQLLKEAIRDLEISWLSKLKSEELQSSLSSKLCTDFPSHLPLHHQNLEIQFDKMDKAETFDAKQCREVIRLSEIVLGMISQDELAKYFGVSHENNSPKDKDISSKKEKEKSILIYALVAKATALQKLNENNVAATSEAVQDFDLILKTLAEWVGDKPKSHGRYLLLWSWQQHSKGFSGTCLLPIIKFLHDKKDPDCGLSKKLLKIKMNIFEKLGWKVWNDAEAQWNLIKFPKDYAIF